MGKWEKGLAHAGDQYLKNYNITDEVVDATAIAVAGIYGVTPESLFRYGRGPKATAKRTLIRSLYRYCNGNITRDELAALLGFHKSSIDHALGPCRTGKNSVRVQLGKALVAELTNSGKSPGEILTRLILEEYRPSELSAILGIPHSVADKYRKLARKQSNKTKSK